VSSPLTARSGLAGIATPGRHGKADGAPGVTVTERTDLGLATLAVHKGQSEALKLAVRVAYGVDLPDRSIVVPSPKVSFIGTGPGQWLAVSETLKHEALAHDLAKHVKGLASVSDQSGGRTVLRVSGPHARDVLAKGLPIDLDPSVFSPNGAVTSVISLMGVQLWQVDETPAYDIAVFRSLSGSFWRWLTASAAEFGYEVSAAA
jgi:heterotetrameric sarcosine oxidase gamma subunit